MPTSPPTCAPTAWTATAAPTSRAYGRHDLDAALLVLPLLGIEPVDSPLLAGTIDAVRRDLGAGGPLLYRYPPVTDGLAGGEGAFLPCSFWLVQALAATGAVDEAVERDGRARRASAARSACSPRKSNPPPARPLGNFPQAFTHATARAGGAGAAGRYDG